MYPYMLSTDSCCDKYVEELESQQIFCLPMAYVHNGVETRIVAKDSKDYRDFYDFVRAGNLPTTTQLNVMETIEYFEKLLTENEGDLVHLTLSSGLSGTYDNAVAAAKFVMEKHPDRKIHVVDSLGATQVQAYVLDRGVADRLKGMSAEETAADMRAFASCLNVMILPRDLFHLHRGGRVSKAAAVVGTMFQIKPLIIFDKEGHLLPIDKVKGWTKGLRAMVKFVCKNAVDLAHDTVYIAHADAAEEARELAEMLSEEGDVKVHIGYIGPVIGTHTGPGTLGIICVGKPRER